MAMHLFVCLVNRCLSESAIEMMEVKSFILSFTQQVAETVELQWSHLLQEVKYCYGNESERKTGKKSEKKRDLMN
jgi:hypothetical protein